MNAAEDLCLHQLFERQVARTPDAPAVTDGRQGFTYHELDELSSRLATVIRRYRPAPGSRIGLYIQRGANQVITILAAMKAGCAYVPLDPAYPRERVRHMARDAEVDLLVADRDPVGILPEAQVISVDEQPWPGAEAAAPVEVTPDMPAYVIYTSGSSGTPKGVVVSHRNVTALLEGCDRVFDLRSDDTWTLFHSYCFDFSVWEVWGALTHGARLAVVSADVARSPEATLAFLVEHRVTVLNQVPSVFRHLARAAEGDSAAGALVLRYVIFGGEPVDIEAVRAWRRLHGAGTEFVNMYGITETTVFATYRRLPPRETEEGTERAPGAANPELNIGVPLAGAEVVVLGEHGHRVPPGEIGEIYQAGPQLAQGYLNRPDLTAARYPVLDLAGDGRPRRYYRSGDLALVRLDGTLEYAGRADDQVKINGYRIETGEVEHALRGAEGVLDVVVVPTTSRVGDRMLVAFYTVRPGVPAVGMAARLIAHGRTALPAFMMPGRFVQVPSIPLSPSGKADKRALAEQAR
jgi:amino acid adenylation domain-containing protein